MSAEHSAESDAGPSVEWMLDRLVHHGYDGGLHGTCYECPFASEPLNQSGEIAPYHEWANDPTEAYFRCSLPTREHKQNAKRPWQPVDVQWGEYAPCTESEWVAYIKTRITSPEVGDPA